MKDYILTPHNSSVGALRWQANITAADDQQAVRSASEYLKEDNCTAYALWTDDGNIRVATLRKHITVEVLP